MNWWRSLKCAWGRHDYRLHIHYDMVLWRCKQCGRIAPQK